MLPLLLLVLVLAAPVTAQAAFSAPTSIAIATDETPLALGFGRDGKGVVITQAGGRGTQAVIRVPGGKRNSYPDTVVLDSARRGDGGVDLLVRRGFDVTKPGDLILRRVMPSGRVYDLWSVRSVATDGAIARGPGGTVVAWPEGSRLRLVVRPDGGLPSRPRAARIGLQGYNGVDLAVDRRGRLVAAVTSFRTGLVLASVTTRGRVLQRQLRKGVDGLVRIALTARGRVGVLVEDTGIEGDDGECVGDGQGRHIRVVLRAAGATRFGAAQTVESPPFGCGAGGAQLLATPNEGFAVVYQGGSYDHPPLIVRAAIAPGGKRFGAPGTLATDARGDSALVSGNSELMLALLRRTGQPELFSGRLSVLRAGGEELIAEDGASSPRLATDAAGDAVLVWRAAERLHVAFDER